ncbi:MAG: sugar phosphate isomerase/epimerase [Ruminococcaceae bacterium]|nr:sugar phosphate isomerase/epimerase [Oscillospiraceae bacterium]
MKVSVTSYSYSQALRDDSFTIFDAMDHAKAIGADGFEFSGFDTPEGKTPAEQAQILRDYSEKIGLPIVCYAIGGNFMNEDLDAEVERLCREVDIAKILGVPVMRHDVTGGFQDWYTGVKTFPAVLPRLAEGCRRVTEYAKTLGIKTCSENHGRFAQDPDRMVALVTAVNDTNYGTLCDLGNFLCADADSAIAVGMVAPFAYHVHAKDFLRISGQEEDPGHGWFMSRACNYLRGTIIGHGVVPVRQDIKILKEAGYDGYVTVEFEGMEKTLEAIETGVENLKKFIG